VQGAVPTAQLLNARVYLSSRDAGGLAAYATSVSDPASASYGQYLTPAEVKARFGRTDGADDLLTTTPGYDDTTGVGTPDAAYLQSFANH
jgi:subtilase family serine protease